jgi:hypothetical protein
VRPCLDLDLEALPPEATLDAGPAIRHSRRLPSRLPPTSISAQAPSQLGPSPSPTAQHKPSPSPPLPRPASTASPALDQPPAAGHLTSAALPCQAPMAVAARACGCTACCAAPSRLLTPYPPRGATLLRVASSSSRPGTTAQPHAWSNRIAGWMRAPRRWHRGVCCKGGGLPSPPSRCPRLDSASTAPPRMEGSARRVTSGGRGGVTGPPSERKPVAHAANACASHRAGGKGAGVPHPMRPRPG